MLISHSLIPDRNAAESRERWLEIGRGWNRIGLTYWCACQDQEKKKNISQMDVKTSIYRSFFCIGILNTFFLHNQVSLLSFDTFHVSLFIPNPFMVTSRFLDMLIQFKSHKKKRRERKRDRIYE